MNILIVTPFYKHDRNIASVRWTNIATRLAKRHNVIVVTQPHDDMDMSREIGTDENGVLVARLNQKCGYEVIAVKHFGGATGDDWQTASSTESEKNTASEEGVVRKLKNCALHYSMEQKAKAYAKDIIKNVIPKGMHIDVVISSACPFIEMLFGYELKKRLGCKWISDFRDLPFTDDRPHDARIMKKLMKQRLKNADAIITIAHRGKTALLKDIVTDSEKIHVITNGYSRADSRTTSRVDDGKLHLVHTGTLYGRTRKPDLLFTAAQKARSINPSFDYVLECAGGNNSFLIETAEKYGEDKNVVDCGFVPRTQSLELQSKADILLALVVDKPGSLIAKLFEYILNEKPVMCISRSDNQSSEETDMIRRLNLGVAVEQHEPDAEAVLCDFLLKQFALKTQGLPAEYNPKRDMLAEYDHDNLSVRIEQLCLQIIQKA